MGVDNYLVVKDLKKKRALIVDLGRGYSMDASDNDINLIIDVLREIEEMFENEGFIDVGRVKLSEVTVQQLCYLFRLKQLLEKIMIETDIAYASDLYKIFKVFGLVSGLVFGFDGDYEWEIVNEFRLFGREEFDRGMLGELEQEGYEVWMW